MSNRGTMPESLKELALGLLKAREEFCKTRNLPSVKIKPVTSRKKYNGHQHSR